MKVAVVSARSCLGVDLDEPLLLAALARTGAQAEVACWDDPGVAWEEFDLAVVRSTWDYVARRDDFLAWAEDTAARTRLRNRPEVLAWNTDKAYLGQLATAGVPVVPTTFLTPGDEVHLPEEGPFVVKPAVSAGGRDTARYTPDEREAAAAHASALLDAGRSVLVQPYQASVDVRGERALLHIGGEYAYAARKSAILLEGRPASRELQLAEQLAPATATAAERALAEAVLGAVPFDRAELLYARVDLVDGPDGAPLLLELELVEPSMFLEHAPAGAVDAFAAAVVGTAQRSIDPMSG